MLQNCCFDHLVCVITVCAYKIIPAFFPSFFYVASVCMSTVLTCSQHCGKSSASTRVGPTCRANATHPVRIICLERKITAECYQIFLVGLHMRRCPNAHTPLLIVRSLDKIKEDVQQLVSFFGLGMQAGRTQNERNQLLWTHTGTQVK